MTGTDLWSDRANLPSYCPTLLVLSCSKWLSDQLALKLNTLTDLEENQNQFVPGPSIWSRPPRALEPVTSPWCGIDVLTCKVRLKKRLRERIRERNGWRERERENEVFLPPTSIISQTSHEIKVAWDVSLPNRFNHGMSVSAAWLRATWLLGVLLCKC